MCSLTLAMGLYSESQFYAIKKHQWTEFMISCFSINAWWIQTFIKYENQITGEMMLILLVPNTSMNTERWRNFQENEIGDIRYFFRSQIMLAAT